MFLCPSASTSDDGGAKLAVIWIFFTSGVVSRVCSRVDGVNFVDGAEWISEIANYCGIIGTEVRGT